MPFDSPTVLPSSPSARTTLHTPTLVSPPPSPPIWSSGNRSRTPSPGAGDAFRPVAAASPPQLPSTTLHRPIAVMAAPSRAEMPGWAASSKVFDRPPSVAAASSPQAFADRLAEHGRLFEGGFMPLAFVPAVAVGQPVAPRLSAGDTDSTRAGKRPHGADSPAVVIAPAAKRQRPRDATAAGTHLAAPAKATNNLSIAHLQDPGISATRKLADVLHANAHLLAFPQSQVIHLLRTANPRLAMNEAPVAYNTVVFEKTCVANGAHTPINAAFVNGLINDHLAPLSDADKLDFQSHIRSGYDLLLWLNRQGYAPSVHVVTRALNDRQWNSRVFRDQQPPALPRM